MRYSSIDQELQREVRRYSNTTQRTRRAGAADSGIWSGPNISQISCAAVDPERTAACMTWSLRRDADVFVRFQEFSDSSASDARLVTEER
jgi:hypothetical protein